MPILLERVNKFEVGSGQRESVTSSDSAPAETINRLYKKRFCLSGYKLLVLLLEV